MPLRISQKHAAEKDFEEDGLVTSQILFGKDTIFINANKKIESKSLGGTISGGYFFDFPI